MAGHGRSPVSNRRPAVSLRRCDGGRSSWRRGRRRGMRIGRLAPLSDRRGHRPQPGRDGGSRGPEHEDPILRHRSLRPRPGKSLRAFILFDRTRFYINDLIWASHLPGSKKLLNRFSDDRRHGRSAGPIDGNSRIAVGGEISVEKAGRLAMLCCLVECNPGSDRAGRGSFDADALDHHLAVLDLDGHRAATVVTDDRTIIPASGSLAPTRNRRSIVDPQMSHLPVGELTWKPIAGPAKQASHSRG